MLAGAASDMEPGDGAAGSVLAMAGAMPGIDGAADPAMARSVLAMANGPSSAGVLGVR